MNWRTARLIIGILAVVCFGLVASVVYPLSTSTPHASLPPDEQFSAGDREAFSVETRLTVDGETTLALDGTATADGPRYMRLRWGSDSVVETYQAGPNATVYTRITDRSESRADSRRTAIESDADRELLRETETDRGTVFVVRTNDSIDFAAELSGSASVFVNSLQLPAYERVAGPGEGDETATFEPQNGWFDEESAYRISDASGQVRVDSETGAVQSATVSWGFTQPADTYAHTRLARLFGDQPQRYRIDYDSETDTSNVSKPAWAPAEASTTTR
ncbi:MAG: hypothetical protein U9O06_13385 [Euryarchaeota archaeon]|nr:hypothetical protein [Euryarchaeota archaeon]